VHLLSSGHKGTPLVKSKWLFGRAQGQKGVQINCLFGVSFVSYYRSSDTPSSVSTAQQFEILCTQSNIMHTIITFEGVTMHSGFALAYYNTTDCGRTRFMIPESQEGLGQAPKPNDLLLPLLRYLRSV
jgi:hypothetical protein